MQKSVKLAAEIFKALGDTTRLQILAILVLQGNAVCVGLLAGKLNVSQPAVSQHLKVLKAAGLVEANRQGVYVHYTIKREMLDAYNIDIQALVQSIKADLNLDGKCHLAGDEKKCNGLNQ